MNDTLLRRSLGLAIVLSLALVTGCGGGGGGTSPAPNVAAPAGPSTSPGTGASPTPAPGATSSSPSTPVPAPSTQSISQTAGRFSLIQLADAYGVTINGTESSLSTSQIQSEAPYYDAVWASFQPATWATARSASGLGPMWLSQYTIPFEDDYLISNCNLQCWENGPHPDWIMFACDSNGNPTTNLPWAESYFPNDVPLNIHNSAVVNYQLNTLLLPYMQTHNLNALAIDQVTFENFLQAPNPEVGQSGPPSPYNGAYDCGYYSTWSNGAPVTSSFVYVYGGPGQDDFDKPDQTFIQDEIAWVAAAHQAMSGVGYKVFINHPPAATTPTSQEISLLQNVDGVVDEQGFTDYGQYTTANPSQFTSTLSWVQYVQQQMNKTVFLADYICNGQPCQYSSAQQLTDAQVDYALATYALANFGRLGLYVAPLGVGQFSYRTEFSKTYGTSCSAMTQPGSNLYEERFSGGMAIVNASSSPQNVTIPSNHTYTDIETGGTVSGTLTVGPSQGYMLLTSGSGCS